MEIPIFPKEAARAHTGNQLIEAIQLLARLPDPRASIQALNNRILRAEMELRLTPGLVERYCEIRKIAVVNAIYEQSQKPDEFRYRYRCVLDEPTIATIVPPYNEPPIIIQLDSRPQE